MSVSDSWGYRSHHAPREERFPHAERQGYGKARNPQESLTLILGLGGSLFARRGRRVAPEPAHGIRKDGAAMLSGVGAVAPDGFVVVVFVLERRLHLKVAEPPVTVFVVEIVRAVLQEH